MLSGYGSPNEGTVQAAIKLATLMVLVVSVTAESISRMNLLAEKDANEKFVKQAEQYCDAMNIKLKTRFDGSVIVKVTGLSNSSLNL